MSNEKSQNVDLILDRVKKAYNMERDVKLADFLGRAQNTISAWRRRNTLDYELIITKCDDLNLHWVMFGMGPMLKEDLAATPGRDELSVSSALSDYEHQIDEIVHKIEHGSFSPDLKLRVIDSLLRIVGEELEDTSVAPHHDLSDCKS